MSKASQGASQLVTKSACFWAYRIEAGLTLRRCLRTALKGPLGDTQWASAAVLPPRWPGEMVEGVTGRGQARILATAQMGERNCLLPGILAFLRGGQGSVRSHVAFGVRIVNTGQHLFSCFQFLPWLPNAACVVV